MGDSRTTVPLGEWCPRCRKVHTKCAAHRKRDGQPCGMNPEEGAEICRKHGGGAPQVIAAAERRRAEEYARQAAARWALPIEIGPGEALLHLVHKWAGMVAWYEVQVQATAGDNASNLIRGVRSQKRLDKNDGWQTATEAGPGVSLWLQLLHEAMNRLREVSRDALAAGIEERRVQITEQLAGQVVTKMRDIFDDPELALTPEQKAKLGIVVPRHLRLVT